MHTSHPMPSYHPSFIYAQISLPQLSIFSKLKKVVVVILHRCTQSASTQISTMSPSLHRQRCPHRASRSLPHRTDKQLLRQWEQHICAHDSRDRTCIMEGRETCLSPPSTRGVVHIELHAPLHEAGCNIREPEVNNPQHRLASELVEDDHRIEPVQLLQRELFLDKL